MQQLVLVHLNKVLVKLTNIFYLNRMNEYLSVEHEGPDLTQLEQATEVLTHGGQLVSISKHSYHSYLPFILTQMLMNINQHLYQ